MGSSVPVQKDNTFITVLGLIFKGLATKLTVNILEQGDIAKNKSDRTRNTSRHVLNKPPQNKDK